MLGALFSLLITSQLYAVMTNATGKELLEYCKIAMDIHDTHFGKPQTDPEYILGVKTGICEGYLMSANEMHVREKPARNNTQNNTFCLPINYNLLIGATVVVKYIEGHPAQENLPASVLVAKSLATYFPCVR